MNIVSNVCIYDLDKSIIAAGYPMSVDIESQQDRDLNENDFKRCNTLINACVKDNQAHGQFLTGIRVNFDLTCSNKMWVEAERYRFLEFVSSQSTMHRITKFNLDEAYIKYVDSRIIDIMKKKVAEYNDLQECSKHWDTDHMTESEVSEAREDLKNRYLEILYSNPCGFKLTAGMTTNYQQLKTIYAQRKDHRLPEWRTFCKWIETLPHSEFITTIK